jgi:sterol desaturase/sphingolipid hydroxylase (fatty acid hydroxylase superfamily)
MPWLNPVFVAMTCLAVLEAAAIVCVPRFRRSVHWKAWVASLLLAAVMYCFPLNVLLGTFYPLKVAYQHGLHLVKPDDWFYWPVLYVSHEFFFYWYHRSSHRLRWLWLTHGVHHTSTEMTIPAGMRSITTGFLSFGFLWFLPMAMLGFRRGDIGAMNFYAMTWQTWLHTELVPKLGPLELVLMTPSNHRMHHRCEVANLDRNFGGTLVVFDHLFSTYRPEPDGGPKLYGIGAPPFDSVNPLLRVLAVWKPFFRSVVGIRGLSDLRGVWTSRGGAS